MITLTKSFMCPYCRQNNTMSIAIDSYYSECKPCYKKRTGYTKRGFYLSLQTGEAMEINYTVNYPNRLKGVIFTGNN